MSFVREIKNSIIKLCKNNFFRKALFPLIRLLGKRTYLERILKIEAEEKYFLSTNNNRIVLDGPFKGMKYASFNSYGSELAPKIIGSYELELRDVIREVIEDNTIKDIVDIGSAEGYYAIGFALQKPDARIHAFDIKKEAVDLSKRMAKENNVYEKISFGSFCSAQTLHDFNFTNRGFILSDCEGYEMQLFNESNLTQLKKCDILIEMHDFINPKISVYLKKVFSKTHEVSIITSERRNPIHYPELAQFTEVEQKLILSECRQGILDEKPMEWLYAKARA